MTAHIDGRERYGVLGGDYTQFLAIDLDLHEGDPKVFLDQLDVLLGEFHGRDGWHYQVADQAVNGIHLIRVLKNRTSLAQARAELQKRLEELDREHPVAVHEKTRKGAQLRRA